MKIKAHFDGSCEPCNPGGTMGMGIHLEIINKGKITTKSYGYKEAAAPTNTNNVAEYLALQWLLNHLLLEKITGAEIKIYGDSKLVVMQMKGLWKIKFGYYSQYAVRCRKLINDLALDNKLTIDWVPREQNTVADGMSKQIN